jgi:hypothetical protein
MQERRFLQHMRAQKDQRKRHNLFRTFLYPRKKLRATALTASLKRYASLLSLSSTSRVAFTHDSSQSLFLQDSGSQEHFTWRLIQSSSSSTGSGQFTQDNFAPSPLCQLSQATKPTHIVISNTFLETFDGSNWAVLLIPISSPLDHTDFNVVHAVAPSGGVHDTLQQEQVSTF